MKSERDALGWCCFLIHVAALAAAVLGWLWPGRGWLVFYLIYLPVMFLHWKLNRGACILNNLENWLRHRRWRAPETNREEGAWLRTLLADTTGIALTQARMDAVIYAAMALFWLLGLARWTGKF
ncbi:MAG: hypothetical protein J0I19_13930 [Alphaproteobacteria bacterium]|nr:hypothetical protein [Alphaproteobacteria bacterium]